MPTPVTDTKIEKNRVAKIFLSEVVNIYSFFESYTNFYGMLSFFLYPPGFCSTKQPNDWGAYLILVCYGDAGM